MNKKMSKRQRDLKSKLMAAICMLLVSSIMMVSTTYAWFTLSTAPEVTGITTAVGANGNLEMALLPTVPGLNLNDLDNQIVSSTGDSKDAAGKLLKEANITWGNLVDLQDNNSYGLDRITLYPAALNVEGGDLNTNTAITAGSIIGTSPLGRPVYGADGRVASLKADTLANTFASGVFSVENTYGVRAVGTSSNMSPRELEHRSLLSLGNSSTNAAKSLASGALETHGATLAGLAIKKVNGGDDVTADEVAALNAIVDSLAQAMDKMELAIRYYVAANAIAPADKDATYLEIKDAILGTAEGGGFKNSLATIGTTYASAVPANFDTAVSALNAEKTNIANAKADFPASGATTWSEVSVGLNLLVNTDKVKINGVEAKDAKTDTGINQIIDFMFENGIQLSMASGSGAMATIADFCGDYSSFIVLPEGTNISMGNMTASLSGKRAVMKTESTVVPGYLVAMESGKVAFAAGTGGTEAKAISDFYGYIIDLAFRTNAANSNLLLQTAPENRIYEGNDANEAVMGHGSSMTFVSGASDFPATSMLDLMDSIRVVFFETAERKVIAEARLDTANAKVDGAQVTAELFMYKSGNLQTAQYPAAGADPDAVTAKNDSSIISLEQNKAKAISVLVYLDGHSVTNKDVAATGSASMTGSMNLQFASSANLVPMDYTDLMQGEGSGSGTAVTTVNLTNAAMAEGTTGISVATARYVETATEKYVGVILRGNLPANPVVTITVGEGGSPVEAEYMVIGGIGGYAIDVANAVEEDAKITVSVAEGEAPATPVKYTVTNSLPTDVTSNGAAEVTANTAYTFTVTNASEKAYKVIYEVEDVVTNVELGTVAAKSGDTNSTAEFTIPADRVTNNLIITYAEVN